MKRKLLYSCKYIVALLYIVAVICYGANVSAQSSSDLDLHSVLNTRAIEQKIELERQALTNISNNYEKTRLRYTPTLPLFDDAVDFIKKRNPTILYESLYLLKEDDADLQATLFLKMSNLLRDVQMLAIIEYQNLKDGNIHSLFNSSERIVSKTNLRILAPPVLLSTLPAQASTESIYVAQEMPPFGQVLSQYQYSYDKHYSAFVGSNTSKIAYYRMNVVKEDNMFTACWIIRTKEGILIYGIGGVRTSGFASLFANVISNSFTSRMVGLFEWLNKEILTTQELANTNSAATTKNPTR